MDVVKHSDYTFWSPHFARFEEVRFPFRNMLGAPLRNPLDAGTAEIVIPALQMQKFSKFCSQNECTDYMGLLSAFYILLYRYTLQPYIAVGSVIADRPLAEFHETIGFFVNNNVSCVSFDEASSQLPIDIMKQIKNFV